VRWWGRRAEPTAEEEEGRTEEVKGRGEEETDSYLGVEVEIGALAGIIEALHGSIYIQRCNCP